MVKRNIRGQEATEFVLITVLVFFSALLVVFLFGGKIANFFNKESSVANTSNLASRAIKSDSNQKYNNNVDPYSGPVKTASADSSLPTSNKVSYGLNSSPVTKTFMAGTIAATEHENGTVSFMVGKQEVTIPPDSVEKANQVFQTTGSSGTLDLIKEMAALMEKYQKDYPDGEVPLDVIYGNSNTADNYADYIQQDNNKNPIYATFDGGATASSITLKVGSHMVFLQKDHYCTSGACDQATAQQRRVEGDIITDNSFSGKLSVYDLPTGKYIDKVPQYDATISIANNGLIQSFDHTTQDSSNTSASTSTSVSLSTNNNSVSLNTDTNDYTIWNQKTLKMNF